jgi:hypothetical protein
MFEGPTPADLDSEAWLDTRARFLSDVGYGTLEQTRQYLKGFENTLAAFSQHEEVVIWLDHRLSDQLILIKVLDWFSRRNLGGVKLSLICVDHCLGVDHFLGLGALTENQLASLAGTRVPVGAAQYRTAQAAWNAFTSPDPRNIERFIQSDTSALPFIATALRRHLEQFPAVGSGLSRTERQALSVLRERGSISGPQLFVAVQSQEEAVFMGDDQLYRIVADLSEVRHPLVQISDTVENRLGNVTITETGRKVLEGQADHIGLNGIDRWLGGVHLQGDKPAWRWDSGSGRIVGTPLLS